MSVYLYNVTVKQRQRCLRPCQLEAKHTSYEILEYPASDDGKQILFSKLHYINCLMEKLGMSTMTGNPTYNLTAMSKDEILQTKMVRKKSKECHHSVLLTF